MKMKTDHLTAVIREVAGKISELQDLHRGLHKLKAERDREIKPPRRASRTGQTRKEDKAGEPQMDADGRK